ncbi:FAD-dependent oxidoreductase [Micromonospora sp. CPCC 205371]|nr:FAD-dependent oxidoreductase [Micromonospora sp. CPCC 205371]
MPTFVIIGASLAGAKAAETLRAEGFDGRIVLVGEETERPYERPPLSKGYMLGKEPLDKAFVHDEAWYAEHDVELMLGCRATNLDADTHTVTLDGVAKLTYDKLLLATGSRVRTLSVPGAELSGVRYLRTIDEAETLLERLRDGSQVLVVGAGWIGLEVAGAAREHGCPVTVVPVRSLPLPRGVGDRVGAVFRDLHVAHGVDFRFGMGIREFGGSGGQVTHAVLEDGTEVPADLVVAGVGIRPATELADAGGLAVDNGVVTDAALRTANPDVYACGDVASFEHPLIGERIRVEHWSNALNGGPAAARSMLGQPVSYDRVPYFFTDQYDLGMEYAGWAPHGSYDSVVFRGDVAAREFVAFWVKGGRVLAGMNVNIWDVQDDIQALVRAGFTGHRVDETRLSDPSVPLRDALQ